MILKKELLSKLGKLSQTTNISNSLKIAETQHKGQLRDNGNHYLEDHIYPITLAVLERYKDSELLEPLICTAILHDVLEDTDFSEKEMVSLVGEEITEAVKVLSKSESEKSSGMSQEIKMENNRKYLQRVSNAPIIPKIVKMEDRIQNLSCITKDSFKLKPEKYKRYVYETRELFVPIAKKLNGYSYYEDLLESECKRVEELFERMYKAIIIGTSLSGKTTVVRYLRQTTAYKVSEIDEELTTLNGGTFPMDANHKNKVLFPEILKNLSTQSEILFFTNAWYFEPKDLKKLKRDCFKILQLSTSMDILLARNKERIKTGYEDMTKYLDDMLEYQKEIYDLGLVDSVIDAKQQIEKVTSDILQAIQEN